jgi:uncharacterized membrane protein YhaH (DUF805 family)
MDWLSFRGCINRKKFAFRIVTIWVIFVIPFYVFENTLTENLDIKSFMILKLIIELIIVFVCIPSIIRRLREIEWPVFLSLLFLLSTVLSIRTLLLLGIQETAFIFYSSIFFGIISLIIFPFLLFKKGSANCREIEIP